MNSNLPKSKYQVHALWAVFEFWFFELIEKVATWNGDLCKRSQHFGHYVSLCSFCAYKKINSFQLKSNARDVWKFGFEKSLQRNSLMSWNGSFLRIGLFILIHCDQGWFWRCLQSQWSHSWTSLGQSYSQCFNVIIFETLPGSSNDKSWVCSRGYCNLFRFQLPKNKVCLPNMY